MYIADYSNHRVRKVTISTGIITTFAGTGSGSFSGDNGQASSAELFGPYGVAFDTSGNVYIGDSGNCCIRKVTASTDIIATIAGTGGTCSFSGDGGQATSATLYYARGVTVDTSGTLQ